MSDRFKVISGSKDVPDVGVASVPMDRFVLEGTWMAYGRWLSSNEINAASVRSMGRRIDVEDLLTATEVADLLGLSMRQVVSTYARRYDTFPRPAVVKSNGHTQLWAREDVAEWDREHRRVRSGERGGA